MSKTIEDLNTAFAGESQASQKYTAFAKKTDEEGYPQIARLFRAAAQAEAIHALNHFRAMGEVKETRLNLQAAISGENYEVTSMYPQFIKDAEDEGEKKARLSFRWAYEVEKIHEALYKKALESMGKSDELLDYFVCPICGYTHEGAAPEKCPVCGAPGSRFARII
jgi:rubrerythrin